MLLFPWRGVPRDFFLSGSRRLLTDISEDDILYIVRRYIGG